MNKSDQLESDPMSLLESQRTKTRNTPISTQKLFQSSAKMFGTRKYDVEIFKKYSQKIRNRNQFKPEVITEIGKMVSFRYIPKTYSELPYFDMNPLIFILNVPNKNEVIGMNFHYLPPTHRLMAYYSMFSLLTDKTLGENSRFRLYYDMLKSQKRFARNIVCIKKYKTERIRSSVYEIDPKYWESAIVIPTQKFMRRKENSVYMDVNTQIRKILGTQQ